MIIGLDHVQLAMPPGREQEARAFYSGLLGLAELTKPAQLQGRGGAWFRCGALQLHLGAEENFIPARKAHPALLVENYEALLKSLEDSSCPVRRDTELPGTIRAFTEDPFGNRIELISADQP
jgi:catechol 2,3-dioxygenase-like lactoylglutathione lyase family enzyme